MIGVTRLTAHVGSFVLDDITFTVDQGAYGIVIGPAGAGKTTLLETIAGLTPVASGTVVLGGTDVTRVPPEWRRLGLVYQHAYLFPHLNVAENIAYGASSRTDAGELAERFGVAPLGDRDVRTLSGGERQLVALARALASRPDILLLDEPFAALDARTRTAARRALRALYLERRFTALHVTHDFAEAGMLGDIMLLLHCGRLLQSGSPEDVFRRPATAHVADFLGAENVFAGHGRVIEDPTEVYGLTDLGGVENRAAAFTAGPLTFYAAGEMAEAATHAVIRAEEIGISRTPASSSIRNQFNGTIVELAPMGAITRVTMDVSGVPFVAAVTSRSVEDLQLRVGEEVVAAFKATAVHLC